MKTNKTFYVALYGIMLSVIMVAMQLDKWLSAGLGISMALIVLLVMFSFAFIKNEWQIALFAGIFFGLASLIKETYNPSALTLLLFESFKLEKNIIYLILIPVPYLFARVPVGITAFGAYRLFLMFTKNSKMSARAKQILSISIGTLIGLMVNTTLFLGTSIIIKDNIGMEYAGFFVVIWGVMFTNIIPEYLISIIGAPLIVLGVRKGLHLGIEALPQSEEE